MDTKLTNENKSTVNIRLMAGKFSLAGLKARSYVCKES